MSRQEFTDFSLEEIESLSSTSIKNIDERDWESSETRRDEVESHHVSQ